VKTIGERIAEAEADFEIQWMLFMAKATPRLKALVREHDVIKVMCALFHSRGSRFTAERIAGLVEGFGSKGSEPRDPPA